MAIRVEFPGLCLFVVEGKKDPVTVLLPNARNPNGETHPDGREVGKPHYAWYYETRDGEVQRKLELEGNRIAFDAGSGRPRLVKFDGVVNIGGFTSGLSLRPDEDLRDSNVAAARVTLEGGSLKAAFLSPKGKWSFEDTLRSGHHYRGDQFAYRTVWEPGVSTLKVKIDGKTHVIEAPDDTEVRIVIGNVDYPDPEEWDTVPIQPCVSNRVVDTDFKWYYRLFRPKESWEAMLQGKPLPAPSVECDTLDRNDPTLKKLRAAGAPTCFGGSWCPPTGDCG